MTEEAAHLMVARKQRERRGLWAKVYPSKVKGMLAVNHLSSQGPPLSIQL